MTEEVHVRFEKASDSNTDDILSVLGAHFDLPEGVPPKISANGVLVSILKDAWESADKNALKADLHKAGFSGNFTVESTSKHGYA